MSAPFPAKTLCCLAACLFSAQVLAAGWNATPQPLVQGTGAGRGPVLADEGSPLVMDSAWRILWKINYGELNGVVWNGRYFQPFAPIDGAPVASGSSLVMDEGFHQVFFVGLGGTVSVCQRAGNAWKVYPTVPEPVTTLLGVDQAWHCVYAHDAGRGVILAINWDAKAKKWSSRTAASGLGNVSAAGAVDSVWHVLYSVHEDAPDLGAAACTSPFFKPWPLVATWWDGSKFHSQLIDQTGAAQTPAVRRADHRVFYTRSDDLVQTRWFQPARNPSAVVKGWPAATDLRLPPPGSKAKPVTDGEEMNWQGLETFVDDQSYTVNLGPVNYFSGVTFTVRSTFGTIDFGYTGFLSFYYNPVPPFKLVAAKVPDWSQVAVPDRMVGVAAAVSDTRGELIQQRATNSAGTGYEAAAWKNVEHIYQDATGTYFRLGAGASSKLSYGPAGSVPSTPASIDVDGQPFYDPLSVPATAGTPWWSPANASVFSGPVVTGAWFYVPASMTGSLAKVASADAVLGSPPLPAPRLVPGSASLRSFGQPMVNHTRNALPGCRFQTYTGADYQGAMTGGIACDRLSRLVFYTQAPPPNTTGTSSASPNQVWVVVIY